MVEAALSSARAMAMSSQNYVGVRFQKLCVADNTADPLKNLLNAPQYMIFIRHEEPKNMGDLANGFRAVEGLEPIRLPETMGVMDLSQLASSQTTIDGQIDQPFELSDATTFSIIFAPSGKATVHPVRVRNRDGVYLPKNDAGTAKVSNDDVFNSSDNICGVRIQGVLVQHGMFLQDDYSQRNGVTPFLELGLGSEDSRTSFVIYEVAKLRPVYEMGKAWSGYLTQLTAQTWYVSPYTGNLISSQ